MNSLVLFLFAATVVTSAPTSGGHQHKSGTPVNSTSHACHRKSQEEKKSEQYLLREIMDDVKNLKMNLKTLTYKTLQKEIQNVFINEECNRETFCKAGDVLSAYNVTDLGLKSERDWRLPRRIHAYSKSQNCTSTDELNNIPLDQFLDKIRRCAQKFFSDY